MNNHYSMEEKKQIVKSYIDGKEISEIIRNTGISRSTIYSWINQYKNEFTINKKLNLKDYHDLKQKCERL